jgi:hypothetical protein
MQADVERAKHSVQRRDIPASTPPHRNWHELDPALSEVTGRINRGTTGFWFERLEEISKGQIDVRSFSKLNGERLNGFQIHESAFPSAE